MRGEYFSLEEIGEMINKLSGFREPQLMLIKSIAEKSYRCGWKRGKFEKELSQLTERGGKDGK